MQVPIEDKAKVLLHLSRILFTLMTLEKKIIFINNVVVCTAKELIRTTLFLLISSASAYSFYDRPKWVF